MIIYAIHPGYIYSRADGDRHFITGKELIRLYGVNPRECIIVDYDEIVEMRGNNEMFIHLYPRSSGNYELGIDKSTV